MPVKFKSEVSLDALNNATVDTDKILVSDNGIVKYRTGTEIRSDIGAGVGSVTSVGLTMPVAFSVANSPITSAGNLEVTAIGTASQYIRGDGQLATLPASGGGGSSVFYYLNGSVAASVATYKQMDNTPVIGGGTDFNLVGNGLIAQFLTDIGNPNRIQIPGGAWNFEMFFNMSSVGGNTKFYVELLKYNGATFTSIASNITVPEEITGGTNTDLYLTSIAVPETVLLTTDRLVIRVYIVDNSGGRTATLHTEDNTLCQVTTTFSAGVTSINGISENTQYLAVGTSGTDFNISSLLNTHTFNLPTASSTKRGALSITDWLIFNSKISGLGTANYIPKFTAVGTTIGNSIISDNGTNVGIGTSSAFSKLEIVGGVPIGLTGNVTLRAIQNQTNYKGVGLGFDTSSHTGIVFAETTDTASNLAFWTYSGLSWAERMRITSGGAINIKDGNLTGGGGFEFTNEAGFGARFQSNAYKFMNSSNSSEFMRITSSGNVGIGTSSPLKMLDIVSTTNDSFDAIVVRPLNLTQTLNIGWRGIDASFDFRLNTGGAERMVVTTTGNVGIGTTSPLAKFVVSNGGAQGMEFGYSSGLSSNYIQSINRSTFAPTDFALYLGELGASIKFYTETVERMRIASSGNVGIGTTSPGATLDVITESRVSYAAGSQYRMRFTNTDGNGRILVDGDESSLIFGTSASGTGSTATEKMRITSSGNVGIGTTSPEFNLHLGSVDASEIGFEATGTGGGKWRVGTGSTISGFGNDLRFYNSTLSAERMRITSSGNVGIGTTSPSAKLVVVGASSNTYLAIDNAGSGENYFAANAFHAFQTSGSERMRITSGGNVGIGTSSPTAKLQVVGLVDYATNALAIAGGLTLGAFYHTAGVVKVVI